MAQELGPTNAQVAQKQITTIREVFNRSAGEITKALPRHLSSDRMLRTAMTSILRTPSLLACDIKSLIGAVMQAAQLGLELDTNLGFAYLVPFKDQVQLIPGYKGLVNLAYRSGLVLNIDSRIVRVGEEFEFEYGTNARVVHRPKLATTFDNEKTESNVVASYCIAYLKGGERHFEVRSKAEIRS